MDDSTKRKLWVGLPAMGALAAAAMVGGSTAVRKARRDRPHDDAPGRTTHSAKFGDYDVVGRTVTIDRPRSELFAFWRDFQNLPRFMENIEKVQPTGPDGRAVWTVSAPAGRSVDIETEIVREERDELIAWRSVEGSDIDTEGRVAFRDAPGGRGTYVEAVVAYKPPAGELGRRVAKLFMKEPNIQARHDLKRFKMLMETGEIATSARTREEDNE